MQLQANEKLQRCDWNGLSIVPGAVQESLSEEFNNQIRELRDADLLDKVCTVSETTIGATYLRLCYDVQT